MKQYPLAKQGVFLTVQGEGALLGLPMIFVRLAGCSIGCPLCDTNYKKASSATALEITAQCRELKKSTVASWVWITGGEPTDHDCEGLIDELRRSFRVAMATAGHKAVPCSWRVDFLSVSPHDPREWVQKVGSELKLVPGLNSFGLSDFNLVGARFDHQFVSPCDGKPETVSECQAWVNARPGWRMTPQAHKQWEIA